MLILTHASSQLSAWRWLNIFLLLSLGACANLQPHLLADKPFKTFQGRFFIQYLDQLDQKKHLYGNFILKYHQHDIELSLKAPFGSTLAIIEQNQNQARLLLPKQAPKVANNVAELMEDTLGFTLPISNLTYWLNAQPAPSDPAKITYQAHNQIIHAIEQDDWQVTYLNYTSSQQAQLIEFTSSSRHLKVRLVLNH